MTNRRSKFWCFTQNDNPESFHRDMSRLTDTEVLYVCGQLERASTGQLHVQGYVQLRVSKMLSWVRNNISDTAHWEIQRGSNSQARDYCKKEDETSISGTFTEFGEFNPGRGGQGARNDFSRLVEAVKEEKTQREIIEDESLINTYARYLKFHDRIRSLYKPKQREEGVRVILHVGEPGTGKTRKAVDAYPDLFEIPISNGTLWLDGYDNQPVVLFDDFLGAGSKMTLDNTLKFFDRYVRCVPIKGAYLWWKPEIIYVTSNYHPRHWYDFKSREASYKALARRFDEVWCFTESGEPEEQIVEDYFYDRDQWPQKEWGEFFNE